MNKFFTALFGEVKDLTDEQIEKYLSQLAASPATCLDADDDCSSKPLENKDTSIALENGVIVKRCNFHSKIVRVIDGAKTVFAGVAVTELKGEKVLRDEVKLRKRREAEAFRNEIRRRLAKRMNVAETEVPEEDIDARLGKMTEEQKFELLDLVLEKRFGMNTESRQKPVDKVKANLKRPQGLNSPRLVHSSRPTDDPQINDVAMPGDVRLNGVRIAVGE